ncbi:cell surface glycoprotein CD200 receptor 1-like [Rhinoderma darwinii]|uniref:cell surface glycoprotein CD200 receptor 1-like n=1 Tax=Rhinoderma darwinii TaxID=43563 RepID=UPI003F665E3C
MKIQERIHFTFQLFLFVCVAKAKADVLTADVGDDAVLHCVHTIENFIMATWAMDFLNRSSCFLSTIGNGTLGNCSHQMHLDIDKNKMSLRIDNIMVRNEGNYTCQVVNRSGTFLYTVVLQVLAEPFVLIKIDENGHPECQAIGGKPAANISWIPESTLKVKTRSNTELNGTTTVMSSYNTSNITEATCTVYHPTFTSPIERHLSRHALGAGANNLILIPVLIIIFVLLLGIVLFWQRSNLRTCFSTKKGSPATYENPVVIVEEVEPYASFTVKVNTVYSSTNDLAQYKGTQRAGPKNDH